MINYSRSDRTQGCKVLGSRIAGALYMRTPETCQRPDRERRWLAKPRTPCRGRGRELSSVASGSASRGR